MYDNINFLWHLEILFMCIIPKSSESDVNKKLLLNIPEIYFVIKAFSFIYLMIEKSSNYFDYFNDPETNPKISKISQQGSSYFDELTSAINKTYINFPTFSLEPVDMFMWGYLTALHEKVIDKQIILNKIISLFQCENDGIITKTDKQIIYMQLCNNPKYDVDQYIESKFLGNDLKHIKLARISSEDERKISFDLIKNLELEEKFEREKIRKEKEKKENEIPCKICLEPLFLSQFTSLNRCGHVFHIECFGNYVRSAIDARQVSIKCPDECKQEVEVDDFYSHLDKVYIKKFEDYSLKYYVDMHLNEVSWCPTADCKYVFVLEKNENENTEFNCPLCQKHYCLACKCEFHQEQSCQEFRISNNSNESDKLFENFVKGQKWKQCPQCKFWVEKNQGCDHMTCRCTYQFCYKCGGKYQACECVKKNQNQVINNGLRQIDRLRPRQSLQINQLPKSIMSKVFNGSLNIFSSKKK